MDETMKSAHWQRLDALIAVGDLDGAKRLQQAYEERWFQRAKEGAIMNLTELMGGAETVHIADLDSM